MTYAKLTPNCSAITPAITSNHKYILPTDPIYFRHHTRMMTYPGNNDPNTVTYISKNTLPTEDIVEANNEANNESSKEVENRSKGDKVRIANQYNPGVGGCKTCR